MKIPKRVFYVRGGKYRKRNTASPKELARNKRELLSQTMTKNCKRLQTNYNYCVLNTKNTQRQTITIKPQ